MKKLTTVVIIGTIIAALFWYRKTHQYRPLGNILIVGTTADFPPFSFRDKSNAITGFDIDVVKEVAKRLSLEVSLEDRPFGTLLSEMELGKIHIIAAGMTPTEERSKHVNFSKPYLPVNPLLVVTTKATPPVTSLEDLKGKDVLVNLGYFADLYLSKLPDIKLTRLTKVADALTALEQGKAYAFVAAKFSLEPYIKDNEKQFNYFRIQETDENSALAISKKLPDLVGKIQKALDEMEADGTITALRQKWKLS